MKIKTIDVHAKEWFDKVNGNSYFSARATVNFGTEDEKTVLIPFKYGYGSTYIDAAFKALENAGIVTDRQHYPNGGGEALWTYCDKKGIILRYNKDEKCLKRDVRAYGESV